MQKLSYHKQSEFFHQSKSGKSIADIKKILIYSGTFFS